MKKNISADRLAIVRTLLTSAADLLVKQGTLGRNGSQCCNLTESGDQCVVGLLVGPTHFEVGNSKMANELTALHYNSIFEKNIAAYGYDDLSRADKTAFRGILYYLQKIHDGLAASAAETGLWSSDRAQTFVFAGIVGQVLVTVEDEIAYDYPVDMPKFHFAGVRASSCVALSNFATNMIEEIRTFVELK